MSHEYSKSIFGELNVEPNWYAVTTKPRHEKKVFQLLTIKGIESYLPLQKLSRKWSDRYKVIEQPLFSCYVFVRIALKDRLPVLQTDGVVKLVTFNNIPATIPDSQIQAVRLVLEKCHTIEHIDFLTPGQRIEVVQGPLKGISGLCVEIKNSHRLVVRLESIQQAISVDIDLRDIKILE
ncbi:MAG: UpxY family transcription antiterminator [Candidatus Zhuqueibacterota bacterium]